MQTNVHFLSYLSFFLRIRNISDTSFKENQNTFCVQSFLFENLAFYEEIWKNIEERGMPHTWRMRIACWIPKTTNTCTQVV